MTDKKLTDKPSLVQVSDTTTLLRSPGYLPDEQDINLLELMLIVVKRKAFIIKLCMAAAIISLCYSLTLKNIYTATAKILPPQKDSSGGLSALLGQAGGLAGLASGMGLGGGSSDLYLGILKSRSVADAVINKLDLLKELKKKDVDEARSTLTGIVRFKTSKDGIISIEADSRDPRKAALLANTFVEELSRRSVQLNLSKAGSERIFLEKRLEVVKQDLRTAENDMKSFQEQYKTIKADSQATAAIEGIARLKADITAKEVQLAALRNSMTDESNEVRIVQAALGKLKSQLGSLTGRGGMDVIPSVGNVPSLGVEYVRKLRELKIQEAIFEQLTKQFEIAKINEAKDSSSLQVLDEAVPPLKKSKPRRSLIVGLSIVAAFFISIFIVFIQEYLAKVSPQDALIIRDIKTSLLRIKRNDT
ncbi:Wzz/FepE/Etk N-terminal domain-containing protein [Geobacter sp. SVR]|uniref:GumC family protein n=1 Tax=Geobacter sp. SVR TaxID=2495594 RepID=UPI00143EF68D|nr:Wzz/FepE/Etk N-terminal domain-containing protein [Geobacter sp. SVR]BCS53541.1 polysaccharide chain length determinant protein [Geobacter sp. SVR]GCF84262.1 polysaccharide chain length determinant protein [Geobacter sp. SVR]